MLIRDAPQLREWATTELPGPLPLRGSRPLGGGLRPLRTRPLAWPPVGLAPRALPAHAQARNASRHSGREFPYTATLSRASMPAAGNARV